MPVVGDRGDQRLVAHGDAQLHAPRVGVTPGVGQRLSEDPQQVDGPIGRQVVGGLVEVHDDLVAPVDRPLARHERLEARAELLLLQAAEPEVEDRRADLLRNASQRLEQVRRRLMAGRRRRRQAQFLQRLVVQRAGDPAPLGREDVPHPYRAQADRARARIVGGERAPLKVGQPDQVGGGLHAGGQAAVQRRDAPLGHVAVDPDVADVYVGCAPRSLRAGTKDAVRQVWTLWAECDGDAAARAARRFDPAPAMVVLSGSGANCHAYWPLDRPLPAPAAEVANLRLAQALGADRACFDAARILRPPGTLNFKHQPPRPVELVHLERGRRFDAADILRRLPLVTDATVERRWARPPIRETGRDPLLAIAPPEYVKALLGTAPNRGRKVPCPFHHDEHPSLHVYSTASRGWHCYSCGRGGSVYDLAADLWGLGTRGRDFLQLRERLTAELAPELRDLTRHVGLSR